MAISLSEANPDYFTSDQGLSLPNGDWCIVMALRVTSNEGTERQGILTCEVGSTHQIYIRLAEAGFSSGPGKVVVRLNDGTNAAVVLTSANTVTVGAWILGVLQRTGSTKELWIGSFGSVMTLQASSTAALGAVTVSGVVVLGDQASLDYPFQGDLAYYARGNFALSADQRNALARGIPPLEVSSRWLTYLPMPGPAATLRPVIGSEIFTRTGSPGMVGTPFRT